MNFTFLVVVLLTALAFVGVVIALSRAISPRSYNEQKFEAYECGIPTRGKSWMQFRGLLLVCYSVPNVRCRNSFSVSVGSSNA